MCLFSKVGDGRSSHFKVSPSSLQTLSNTVNYPNLKRYIQLLRSCRASLFTSPATFFTGLIKHAHEDITKKYPCQPHSFFLTRSCCAHNKQAK